MLDGESGSLEDAAALLQFYAEEVLLLKIEHCTACSRVFVTDFGYHMKCSMLDFWQMEASICGL